MAETLSNLSTQKIVIKKEWCKGCGICVALCPRVLALDSLGKVTVVNAALCTGCRNCEHHCPDFAIYVGQEVSRK